jgi:transcription elongation factor Elf1
VASPVLPDVRIAAGDGPTGRRRPGRKRLLSCGCCGTRWQFKRTGCPFCETDSQRLASVTIEGEPGLRIDHCESCGGYLKTYDGQGNETSCYRTGLRFISTSSLTIAD